jgi:hypothetical protein
LLVLFKQFTQEQSNTAKRLAIKYPPATIALLGAILETNNENEDPIRLYKALNHQSSYKLDISHEILSNQKNGIYDELILKYICVQAGFFRTFGT